MPEISVIIPALNEEKYIHHLFEGLKTQSYRDFEVIVVDGGSSDRTREICKKNGARVIVEKKPGIARARNVGARHSTGNILVFLDADTKPGKDLLKIYSTAFAKGTVAATGPIFPLEKTNKRIGWGYTVVSVFFVKLSILMGSPNIVGSNFAAERKAFESIGGFDSNLLTYEDWDLSQRIRKRGKIIYIDDAVVKTSARRVMKWGVSGYFTYHIGNMIRYHLFKSPKTEYAPIR